MSSFRLFPIESPIKRPICSWTITDGAASIFLMISNPIIDINVSNKALSRSKFIQIWVHLLRDLLSNRHWHILAAKFHFLEFVSRRRLQMLVSHHLRIGHDLPSLVLEHSLSWLQVVRLLLIDMRKVRVERVINNLIMGIQLRRDTHWEVLVSLSSCWCRRPNKHTDLCLRSWRLV